MELTKEQTLSVKGIAIILLIFHHMFYRLEIITSWGVAIPFISSERFASIAYECRTCVWLFAFVSAYGLTISYKKFKTSGKPLYDFLIRRYVILMSGFWFIFPLVFIWAHFAGKHPLEIFEYNYLKVLINWIGLADLFGTPTLGGVWWYMTFAQVLLVVLPVIIFAVERLGGGVSVVLFFVLVQFIPSDVGIISKSGGNYLQYIPVVILGVSFALSSSQQKNKKNKSRALHIMLTIFSLPVAIVLLCIKARIRAEGFPYNIRNTHWFLVSVAAICIVYFSVNVVKGPVGKIFAFLGKQSGDMFLIHAFFISYCPGILYFSGNVFICTLSLILISLAVSVVLSIVKKVSGYDMLINKVRGTKVKTVSGKD